MASQNKNLSEVSDRNLIDITGMNIAVITAEWNEEVTFALRDGAVEGLEEQGGTQDTIHQFLVPGAFELSAAASWCAQSGKYDAVICLGCVIKGETKHFDFICDAVAKGLTDINIKHQLPVIFGVLTPNNQQQALDRAGGKLGNKGYEAALTAIKMLSLKKQLF